MPEGLIRNGELDSPGSQFRTEGEEIQKTGENTYLGEMRLKVGPVTSSFKGDIEVLGVSPLGHRELPGDVEPADVGPGRGVDGQDLV